MKSERKKWVIIFLICIVIIVLPNKSKATDALVDSQLEALNLSSFIKEGEKYTKDSFENVDIGELLNSAVKGQIETKTLYKCILKILGKEITSSITIIGGILAIIVIHSILKNIGENIGNNSISQVAYYVEYILIVTLIMTSFFEVIDMVKATIVNLVGYINLLIPLLLALVVTSGTAITASVLQPVILGIIVFLGNGITLYILPLLIISTVLGIVSNLSDKIQIGKLSKMLKSSIVWVMGFVLTLFVTIASLEGTLTSSVDGLTLKGLKSASSTFIPVVGKVLGDSVDTVLRSNKCYKKCSWYCWNCSSCRNMCNSNNKAYSTYSSLQLIRSNCRATC